MKILFFGTKSYDREFFDKGLKEEKYKDIDIHYIEPNLTPETAELAHGYDAVCAFVNMDLGKETVDILHEMGVKLILMRCAGYNNVDVDEAKKRVRLNHQRNKNIFYQDTTISNHLIPGL